jgi:hypothetical protein
MTELQQLIYEQLLELYIFDLEIEVLSEKLKNIHYQPPVQPNSPLAPYPWDKTPVNPWWPNNPPIYYGPPYKVTCLTEEPPKTGYSERYDATYDIEKNEWLDGQCDDPNCEYCVNRPERPL